MHSTFNIVPHRENASIINLFAFSTGLADSNALNLAVSAHRACQFVGMPECNVSVNRLSSPMVSWGHQDQLRLVQRFSNSMKHFKYYLFSLHCFILGCFGAMCSLLIKSTKIC